MKNFASALVACQTTSWWAPNKDGPTDVSLAALLPKEEQMFDWMKDLENMPPELLRALGEKAKELGKGV